MEALCRPICHGCDEVIVDGDRCHSFFAHMGPMFRSPREHYRFFWHLGCVPNWVVTQDLRGEKRFMREEVGIG